VTAAVIGHFNRSCYLLTSLIATLLLLLMQVMELSAGESQNGCVSNYEDQVSCQGERRYDEPLRLYVAASDCHSVHGLQLDYELDVYGVTNPDELCSSSPPHRRPCRVRTCCISFVVFVISVICVGAQLWYMPPTTA